MTNNSGARSVETVPVEKVVTTVSVAKLKFGSILWLLASLAGIGVLSRWVLAGEQPTIDDGLLSARVDQRVQAWQPTRAERRLDEIGWAQDIRDALHLAKEHQRPIFLFTYSGSANREHAMALQRC
jgi:hypothetical protein